MLGCILLIACAALISFSDTNNATSFTILGRTVEKIPAIYAVLMALVCPFTFSAQNFIVRVVNMTHSYDPIEF